MTAASKVPFLFRIKSKFLSWSVEAPHGMAFAALPHLSFASSDSSHILAFLKLLYMLFPFLREPFSACLRINLLQGIGCSLQVAWLSRRAACLCAPILTAFITPLQLSLAYLTPILVLFPEGKS